MAIVTEGLVGWIAESDALTVTFEYDSGLFSPAIDMTAVTTKTWTVGSRVIQVIDASDTYNLTIPTDHRLLDSPPFNNVGYADSPTRLIQLMTDV